MALPVVRPVDLVVVDDRSISVRLGLVETAIGRVVVFPVRNVGQRGVVDVCGIRVRLVLIELVERGAMAGGCRVGSVRASFVPLRKTDRVHVVHLLGVVVPDLVVKRPVLLAVAVGRIIVVLIAGI